MLFINKNNLITLCYDEPNFCIGCFEGIKTSNLLNGLFRESLDLQIRLVSNLQFNNLLLFFYVLSTSELIQSRFYNR